MLCHVADTATWHNIPEEDILNNNNNNCLCVGNTYIFILYVCTCYVRCLFFVTGISMADQEYVWLCTSRLKSQVAGNILSLYFSVSTFSFKQTK
jgi:hypothetical protein